MAFTLTYRKGTGQPLAVYCPAVDPGRTVYSSNPHQNTNHYIRYSLPEYRERHLGRGSVQGKLPRHQEARLEITQQYYEKRL